MDWCYELLNATPGRLVWLWLLHSTWIGLLAAGVVAVWVSVWYRVSHRARHRVLVGALAVVVMGPLAAALVQDKLSSRPAVVPWEVATVSVGIGEPTGRGVARSDGGAPTVAMVRGADYRSGLLAIGELVRDWRWIILAGWFSGVVVLGSVLLAGVGGLRRRWKNSVQAEDDVQRVADEIARRLGLQRVPVVRVYAGVGEPCLCGVFRPVVYLAEEWLCASHRDHLEAILAHELAHARRGDVVLNLVQRTVEVLLFFHPGIWWISRLVREQEEFCADALAVRVTGNAVALAEALEAVARMRVGRSGFLGARLGLALDGGSGSVVSRIQELIGMKPSRRQISWWAVGALPVGMFLFVVASVVGATDPREAEQKADVGKVGADVNQIRGEKTAPSDRQVCFEVRRVMLPAGQWRDRLEGRLKLISEEVDGSAWIAEKGTLQDLLKFVNGDIRAAVRQAPKVTTFEGAAAFINKYRTLYYVSRLETASDGKGFRPVSKSIEDGWKVKVSGSFTENGLRLFADIKDSTVLGFAEVDRTIKVNEWPVSGTYQIPNVIERHVEIPTELADGSSLIVSLGLRFNTDVSRQAVNVGLHLMGKGAKALDVHTDPQEQLFLITPRKILVEPGGGVVIPGEAKKAGDSGEPRHL